MAHHEREACCTRTNSCSEAAYADYAGSKTAQNTAERDAVATLEHVREISVPRHAQVQACNDATTLPLPLDAFARIEVEQSRAEESGVHPALVLQSYGLTTSGWHALSRLMARAFVKNPALCREYRRLVHQARIDTPLVAA